MPGMQICIRIKKSLRQIGKHLPAGRSWKPYLDYKILRKCSWKSFLLRLDSILAKLMIGHSIGVITTLAYLKMHWLRLRTACQKFLLRFGKQLSTRYQDFRDNR